MRLVFEVHLLAVVLAAAVDFWQSLRLHTPIDEFVPVKNSSFFATDSGAFRSKMPINIFFYTLQVLQIVPLEDNRFSHIEWHSRIDMKWET